MGIPVYANLVAPLAVSAELVLVAALAVVLALCAGAVGLWRVVGKGPRRNRASKRARELLAKGDWQGAKRAVQEIREAGIPSPEWAGRVNNLEGEVQRSAADSALAAGNYEVALEQYVAAAKLLGLNRDDASAKVVEGMLAELRELFSRNEDDKAITQAKRILDVRPACSEALFWLGLVYIRQNRNEQAVQALHEAHESTERKSVEPTLYLGMLLLRDGKTKDALKYLAEANKAAGNSVLVNWQLGTGLAMSGGDTNFAIRALQKSLTAEGLPKLAKEPDKFWLNALPDDSYIAKLASAHRMECPILGSSVASMIRQAKTSLGQTLYRADRIAEAAGVFQDLANESEPSPALLKSLGIALCRLDRYDEAFPHLKAAWDQDSSKDPLTAIHLAHAAAVAKPSRPDDKPANVRWAMRLLGDLAYPVDEEPMRLVAPVYAEARAAGVAVPVEDQLRLCDTMLALNVADPTSAAAIDQLVATMPDAVRPPFAFLYGRAAQQHACKFEHDLDLLTKLFQNQAAAELHYRERNWDLAAVERLYLERWAEKRGGFPEVFGPDYPARCEKSLLDRACELEAAGKIGEAKAVVDLVRRLIPANTASLDQLAKLAWHRGDLEESARLLSQWAEKAPDDPKPRLRLAVLEQERGNARKAADLVRVAYEKSVEPSAANAPANSEANAPTSSDSWPGLSLRSPGETERDTGASKTQPRPQTLAGIAMVAARLALKNNRIDEALDWLDTCLKQQPDHAEARILRTALLWQSGKRDSLPSLSDAFSEPNVTDPRAQYLAAVCRLAANDLDGAREAIRPLESSPDWQADAQHLIGLIEMRRGNWEAAASQLGAAAHGGSEATADHAHALLGQVGIKQGNYLAAVRAWLQVSEEKRKTWGIAEVLPSWAFLAGVQALQFGDELAAWEWLGRARDLGRADSRLNALPERAAVAAVRKLLEKGDYEHVEPFVPTLERITSNRGSLQMPAMLSLARVRRHRGELVEARDVLRRATPPTAPVLMEIGIVAQRDQRLSEADEVFARVLRDEPRNAAACANLFWTRLSLGQGARAQELLPDLIRAAAPDHLRLLTHVQTLMAGPASSNLLNDMTQEEEQRLLEALFAIGRLDVIVPWLCVLAGARPQSSKARDAQTIGMIRLGKQLFDRGDWLACEKWLSPLAKARPFASVRNLLGCCLCLQQDFASGILHFQEALRLAGDDPRLHQNLALAFTWQGNSEEAELCWGRYLGTADKRLPRPPSFIEYHEQLRFHVLRYLGNQAYDRERWTDALAFLNEAQTFDPENVELVERLFLLQIQADDRGQARKTLSRLQALKPKHAPFELYELDLIEVHNGADLERLLDALASLVERLVEDTSAQDRAVTRVVPQLQARADQLTRVLREVRDDLQRLPEDSNGWYDALRDMRGVRKDLRRLRQIVRYANALQVGEANRHKLTALTDDLERKIDYCRKWEELD